MSWQAYVDNNMVGTGKISRAAIHGHDGSLWATSAGFGVQPAEFQEIFKAYKDPTAIRTNGLHVGGVKYFVLRADDRSIYGKKEASGIVCVKTKQAVLIGIYDPPTVAGEANKIVEALADYLISMNY